MTKSILAVNAGSSSVKVTFYTLDRPPKMIANAQVEGLTAPPQTFKYMHGSKKRKETLKESLTTASDAFKYLLKRLFEDPELSELASSKDMAFICHRIVHGGDYKGPVVIDDETLKHLKDLENLAPLHNFSALEIVRTCKHEIPNVKSVTYFDTSFHVSMPDQVKTYMINQEVAKANGLRRYGFHGISYSFILRSVAEFLNKPIEKTNLITMHIGSGASICAIKNGKSIDTSMGLTPLSGLPSATRSGDIDPSLVFHYTNEAGSLSPASTREMHISTAEDILNKRSGWKVLSGTTDFAQIAVENPPSTGHRLAFDIFVDRTLGYIGSYFVKLEGQVDALVFAGGIGEKSALTRRVLTEKCSCLGFGIDQGKNEKGPGEEETVLDVSKGKDGPRVLVVQTNEQFEMAYHCASAAAK